MSDRASRLWRRLFGRTVPADLPQQAPPLFRLRPVAPPAPRGPGLPDWNEILSAPPPPPDPRSPQPETRSAKLTLVAEDMRPRTAATKPHQPPASPTVVDAAAKRPPTEDEQRLLAEVAALLAAGQISQAAVQLETAFGARPEICDPRGRPIYLLESLNCMLRIGDAAAAADRARRLRPHLAPDDPVIELLFARTAIAANDRAAARASWHAVLARAPDFAEAKAWLATHPASPEGGVEALELLGPLAQELGPRIQPAPSLSERPAQGETVPDWSAGRLLSNVALSIGEDGQVRYERAPHADAGSVPGRDLALVFRHPEGIGRQHEFFEVVLAAFVLQRQFLPHLRPDRLYVGRQPWAFPGASGSPQAAMLSTLFPGLRLIADHDGALHESSVLVVDGALRNAATGTMIGSMMPQVRQWAAEARARVHAACGLPGTAEPPRVAGRRPRVLYLHSAPPRTLAAPVREKLFGLLTTAGYDVAAIEVANLPWHRQICLAYGADMIAGAHGPAMDIAMWAHPQTRVLEFFPEGVRRYDGQLLAEAAGLTYLGLEGVAERGFMTQAGERWGPPVGRANRLIWALPWTMLEQALAIR